MDYEETMSLNNEPPVYNPGNKSVKSQNRSEKNTSGVKVVAAGGAGIAIGAAAGAAVSAHAAQIPVEEVVEVDNAVVESGPAATEHEGTIRFADVSDAGSFSEAFAGARAQVGPGGAFEYHGQLYSTYYAEEWNAMSPGERAEHSRRIIAEAPDHTAASHAHDSHVETQHITSGENVMDPDAQRISEQPADNEIRVLGVEVVDDGDGNLMNVALVESGDDRALLVDVDYNGTIDVMLHDDNGDGTIQPDEVHDISDLGLTVDDLAMQQTPPEDNIHYANCDGMPDYVNDADSIMMA